MPDHGAVDRRSVWLSRCAVLLGLGWLVSRAPNLLVSPRFWAEEAIFVSAVSARAGWDALTFDYGRQGYFSWPANVGTFVAVQLLPLDLAPLATSLLALVLQISPLLAVLWLRFDFRVTPIQHFVAGAALLTATTSEQGTTWLNTISSPVHLGILTSVLLIASARQTSSSRSWALVAILVLTGLAGAYSIFFLPVFVLAAIAEREPWRTRQTIALSAAFLAQLTLVLYTRFGLNLVHEKCRGARLDIDSIFIGLRETLALPMFGQHAVMGEGPFRNFLLFVSLLVAATAVLVLVRSARTRALENLEQPRIEATLRRLGSVALRPLWAWLVGVGAISMNAHAGILAGRYAVVPDALTIIALLMAAQRARLRAVRLLLACVVFTSVATGLWSPRFPAAVACDGDTSGYQIAVRAWTREAPERLPICPERITVKLYPPRTRARS